VGTNFNTNTVGKDFYTYKGGKLDWLGMDDGARALPDGFPLKNKFATLSDAQKIDAGKAIAAKSWATDRKSGLLNTIGQSFQVNGGFHSEEKLGTAAQLKKYAPDIRILNIAAYADDNFANPDWSKFTAKGDYIILTDPKLPKTF